MSTGQPRPVIDRLRAAVSGVGAAWRVAARLDDDLAGLLKPPTELPKERRPSADRLSGVSLRYSRRTLRLLAVLPGGRWRNTCLYRGAAECLLLRGYGIPARLCLGVRNDAADVGPGDEHACDIRAHAWVEVADPGQAQHGERPDAVIRLAETGG
jgi:hypothetical protein